MNFSKIFLVLILIVTLPISQAHALVPDPHSVLSDRLESHEEQVEANTPAPPVETEEVQIPSGEMLHAQTIISTDATTEAIEMQDENLFEPPISADDDHQFWTKKKIIVSTSILLTATLLVGLLLLLAGGGSGGGSESVAGGGAGAGGEVVIPPPIIPPIGPGPTVLPTGPHPHNPEPSTFLLMGLGLLVPAFRKRFSL